MLAKKDVILIWVVVFMLYPFIVLADESDEEKAAKRAEIPVRISSEYFYPTDDSRDITTVNLNTFIRIKK